MSDKANDSAKPTLLRRIRSYLLAGLLVWLPLGVTLFLLNIAVRLMDRSLGLIPLEVRRELTIPILDITVFEIPGIGLILTILILFVTGLLTANLFGRRLVAFGESLLERIPLVRTVYSAVKNFAEIVLRPDGQSFKKVLLIQYPRKGVWSLAFQTSTDIGEIDAKTEKKLVCVFVPTTPNPTSGFIILVPNDEVIELEMSVDEALKMIISLGVVKPPWPRPAARIASVAKPAPKP